MFPAAFDYIRAHSAEEALAALAQHGAEARILAGGQSLIPAMRLRLARPAVLVDLGGVKDLGYLREEGGELRVRHGVHVDLEGRDLAHVHGRLVGGVLIGAHAERAARFLAERQPPP